MNALDAGQRMITVGRLHGAFGVRGEVKLESFTDPLHAIARYQPWILRDARGQERSCEGVKLREGVKGLIASMPGIDDRDAADALRGVTLAQMLKPPSSYDDAKRRPIALHVASS